jgi:hypothetical protein
MIHSLFILLVHRTHLVILIPAYSALLLTLSSSLDFGCMSLCVLLIGDVQSQILRE